MKKKKSSQKAKVIHKPSFHREFGGPQRDKINIDEYPLISEEDQVSVQKLISENPQIFSKPVRVLTKEEQEANAKLFYEQANMILLEQEKDVDRAWIQTYSGRKFNPLKPVEEAIVIQDIAHALAMLCRFTGHVKKFYSVAQHSVLVSYLCNREDALHGLLHDASEAYLQDLPRPLKKSGKFENYRDYENTLQSMIYKRFGLDSQEPKSVKEADTLLLATEARDLMSPLHSEWKQPIEPISMKIEPLGPAEAKDLFMKRFFELKGCPDQYDHYLKYDAIR